MCGVTYSRSDEQFFPRVQLVLHRYHEMVVWRAVRRVVRGYKRERPLLFSVVRPRPNAVKLQVYRVPEVARFHGPIWRSLGAEPVHPSVLQLCPVQLPVVAVLARAHVSLLLQIICFDHAGFTLRLVRPDTSVHTRRHRAARAVLAASCRAARRCRSGRPRSHRTAQVRPRSSR